MKIREKIDRIFERPDGLAVAAGFCTVLLSFGTYYNVPRLAFYAGLGLEAASLLLIESNHRHKRARDEYEAYSNGWMLEQVNSFESQLQGRIDELSSQHETEIANEKADLLASFQGAAERLKESERQHRKQAEALTQTVRELEAKVSELETTIAKLKTEKQEILDSAKGAEFNLNQKAGRLDFEMGQLASAKTRFEDELRLERKRLEEDREWLNRENQDFERQVLAATQQLQAENNMLKSKLAQYAEAKLAPGEGLHQAYANRIILFYEQRGITLDYGQSWEQDDRVVVRVKPRVEDVTTAELKKLGEALQRSLELATEPSYSVFQNSIEIGLSFRSARPVKAIIEPDANWLEESLMQAKNGGKRPNHARFVGESESGKSTLVNNAIGVLLRFVPDLAVELADPLGDSGESEWEFEASYSNPDDCLGAVVGLAETVRERLGGDSDRSPKLLILDETDDMVGQFGESLIEAIKTIWKQGRHVSCWLWVIGQSPYCKTLKLGLYDLRNAVSFYIGSTLTKGLQDLQVSPDKERTWVEQYELRQDSGQEYIVLVAPKRQPCFVAAMPNPGTYGSSGLLGSLVGSRNPNPETLGKPSQTPKKLSKNSGETLTLKNPEPLEQGSCPGNGTGLDSRRRAEIETLLGEGMKPNQIVQRLWGIKPSRAASYKERLAEVEALAGRG